MKHITHHLVVGVASGLGGCNVTTPISSLLCRLLFMIHFTIVFSSSTVYSFTCLTALS